MRTWHILGAGNFGSFVAHSLRKHGHNVTLLMKDPIAYNKFNKLFRTIELTRELESEVEVSRGYNSECSDGYDYGNVIDPRYPNEPCPPHLRIRRLIVTLRSHELSKYYQRIFHRLSPTSTIVLFTYGLGSYEELMRDYYSLDEASRPNVIVGLNSHHVYKKAKFGTQFKLVHSGFGEIDLGIVPRRFYEIEEKKFNMNTQYEKSLAYKGNDYEDYEDLDETPSSNEKINEKINENIDRITATSTTEEEDDELDMEKDTLQSVIGSFTKIPELNARNIKYLSLMSRKLENLALNAVIDPLTTIYSIRNGALLFNDPIEEVIRSICAETSTVIKKHREHLGMLPSNRFATERLIDAVFQICLKTRNNESYMVQDLKKNRKSEVDYLNGYLVKLGKAYNIPTPINQFLIDMIKARQYLQTDPQKLNELINRS